MTIAKRVRDLRYAKGWGPDELASRAEISRTALYQIECGKTETPRAGTLKRIAKALDVTIESLLSCEEGAALELGHYTRDEAAAERAPVAEELDTNGHGKARTFNRLHPSREAELHRKFHELLASPMAESIARIVEEAFLVLPQTRVKQFG